MIPQSERYYVDAHPKQRARVRRLVYERCGGKCAICGEPLAFDGMHVDHIIPLSRGGEDAEHNLQAAHPRCNRSKADKGDAPFVYPAKPVCSDGRMVLSYFAERVGLNPATLRQYIKSGKLRAVKIGRNWFVPPDEIRRFLDFRPGTGGRPPRTPKGES